MEEANVMAATECIAPPKVEISSDRLTVTLQADVSNGQGTTPAELIAHLRELGVAISDLESIEKLADADGRIRPVEDIVLTRGTAPEPEEPARLELLVRPPDPDAASSYYERTAYLTAHAGQAIAKIVPAVPGKDGIDVCGNSIDCPKAPAPAFDFGQNVQLDGDGFTVHATALGRISQDGQRLWIETAAEIPGDVDFSCGNIDVQGDVHIRGSVLDLFKVQGSNIHVGGAIEGAQVTAVHDLHVGGGIVGKDKGHCTAGGDITCKYITNAALTAAGNVSSHGEIAHARIICGGRLTVERGPLASGHVTANGGVCCRSLGSPAGANVLVEAGIDETFRSTAKPRLDEILARKSKAARIRSVVAQIMQHQTQLTPGQKLQAEKSLAEANQGEKTADELLQRLRDDYLTTRKKSNSEILVQEILHIGVTVRFLGIEATTDSAWKGPLRLVPRQHEGEWELVLIDTKSDSTQILCSRPWRDAAFDTFVKMMPS
jgi:hypothetical protein